MKRSLSAKEGSCQRERSLSAKEDALEAQAMEFQAAQAKSDPRDSVRRTSSKTPLEVPKKQFCEFEVATGPLLVENRF